MKTQLPDAISTKLQSAKKVVEQRIARTELLSPKVGMILGTGMGPIADLIQDVVKIPYADLPGFMPSTIVGHQGELLLGRFGGSPVVAMNGRSHLYEGHSIEKIGYPVHFLNSLGINDLIIGNASGGINSRFKSGQVMLIDDHLDLLFQPTMPSGSWQEAEMKQADASGNDYNAVVSSCAGRSRGIFVGADSANGRSPYCQDWIEFALDIGRRQNLQLQRGVYAALTGPNYETRAEYRMLRRLGADAVGMSTVPESSLAVALGMKVCGLSTITNVAKPDIISPTTHDEVIASVHAAEMTLSRLLVELVDYACRK